MKEGTCSCWATGAVATLRQAFTLSAKRARAGVDYAIGLCRIRRIGSRQIAVRQTVVSRKRESGARALLRARWRPKRRQQVPLSPPGLTLPRQVLG